MSEGFDSLRELAVRVTAMSNDIDSDDLEEGSILHEIVTEIEEFESNF